jgi:hypothetical protein
MGSSIPSFDSTIQYYCTKTPKLERIERIFHDFSTFLLLSKKKSYQHLSNQKPVPTKVIMPSTDLCK